MEVPQKPESQAWLTQKAKTSNARAQKGIHDYKENLID